MNPKQKKKKDPLYTEHNMKCQGIQICHSNTDEKKDRVVILSRKGKIINVEG